MNKLLAILKQCPIFSDIDEKSIDGISYKICNFDKDTVIAQEGDDCLSLGIILEGYIEVRKIYLSGKSLTISKFGASHTFGEAIVFSNAHKYPATIVSATKSKVAFIERKNIIKMCAQNPIVLEKFMGLLSDRILLLNRKVKELSYDTLRDKVLNYLFEQYKIQKNLTIKLPLSRKNMAEHLGVQRPSLSRELINMKEDGLIDFDKDTVVIKDKLIFDVLE